MGVPRVGFTGLITLVVGGRPLADKGRPVRYPALAVFAFTKRLSAIYDSSRSTRVVVVSILVPKGKFRFTVNRLRSLSGKKMNGKKPKPKSDNTNKPAMIPMNE